MNANHTLLRFAGILLAAVAGSAVSVACSSDNAAPSEPALDAGGSADSTTPADDAGGSGSSGSSNSGSSSGGSGSSSGAASGSSSGSTTDAGGDAGPNCNPAATIGSDSYNTCSSFGCAGKYDNTAHHVPSPLPTL